MKRMAMLFALSLFSLVAAAQFLETGPPESRQIRQVAGSFTISPPPPEEAIGPELPPVYSGRVNPTLEATLQRALDSLLELHGATGLAAAMALPDGSVWEGAAGINSTALNDSLHPGMVLGIGSVSKNLTAATVLRLYEEGLLSLDDSLWQWLPPYPNIDSAITIRSLLNHTSGIASYTDNTAFWNYVNANLGQNLEPAFILENYVGQPAFAPGEGWSYSNTNYLLLGLIIEAAGGSAYHEAVRSRLLTPHELESPALFPQETPALPLAHLWLDITGDGNAEDFTTAGLPLNAIFSGAWSAGAYLSTAADMSRWISSLMTGQVLQPSTLAEMQATVQVSPNFHYGLGLYRTELAGKAWWGHDGYIFYQALVLYQPGLGIGLALLGNDGEFELMGPVFLGLAAAYEDYLELATAAAGRDRREVEVFPNPFTDAISISGLPARPLEVSLINTQGLTVARERINGSGAPEVLHWALPASLPPGFYLLRLNMGDKALALKMVKH